MKEQTQIIQKNILEEILNEEDLKLRIEKASQAGMKFDNYHQKMEEFRNLRQEGIKGLDNEKEERYKTLEKERDGVEILASNLMEFKKALELSNLPKEKIDKILKHENAHAKKAEQLETKKFEGFRIRFHQDANGKLTSSTSTKITTNMDFPEKQRLEEDILVAEAPLHYGDRPSKRDQSTIDKNKERLNILNQE